MSTIEMGCGREVHVFRRSPARSPAAVYVAEYQRVVTSSPSLFPTDLRVDRREWARLHKFANSAALRKSKPLAPDLHIAAFHVATDWFVEWAGLDPGVFRENIFDSVWRQEFERTVDEARAGLFRLQRTGRWSGSKAQMVAAGIAHAIAAANVEARPLSYAVGFAQPRIARFLETYISNVVSSSTELTADAVWEALRRTNLDATTFSALLHDFRREHLCAVEA